MSLRNRRKWTAAAGVTALCIASAGSSAAGAWAGASGTAAGGTSAASGATGLATRRLHPLPDAAPGVLRFDVSSLPRSAKIVRADLVIARTSGLTGTEEDARVNVEITAASLAQAELLADVQPMSGYNVLGRSVDQLIARHRRRAVDDMDFAKQLARNDYFDKYHPDMAEMGEVPIARLAVEDGRPLGPRMGLYVYHPSQAAEAYYAVVSVVDGVANTRDVACVGPVKEIVGSGAPVLQGTPEVTVFFDYPGQRRQYVQWAAPSLAHLPDQYYNWTTTLPFLSLGAGSQHLTWKQETD